MKSYAKKRFFPGQKDSEKIIALIRRHWFTYMIFWFLAVMMIIPVIIVAIYWMANFEDITPATGNLLILGMSVNILIILALEIYGFINYYLDVYILTDRRIVDIKQNGFFRRSISELNLRQIQDVNAKVSGVSATLFHYGDVDIQTAAEKDIFYFQSVPHPYRTSKKILDLHEAYLRKERSNARRLEHKQDNITISGMGGKNMKPLEQKEIIQNVEVIKKEEGQIDRKHAEIKKRKLEEGESIDL